MQREDDICSIPLWQTSMMTPKLPFWDLWKHFQFWQSLQAGQRFWQRSCKVRVELVEMTAGEDFLIKLLQRLQLWKCSNVVIFCNTAETGVLWRAEQWLERLCSSRCRHGKDSMVTSPYLQCPRSRYRTGLMWCPTCRRKLGGVQEWQKSKVEADDSFGDCRLEAFSWLC